MDVVEEIKKARNPKSALLFFSDERKYELRMEGILTNKERNK